MTDKPDPVGTMPGEPTTPDLRERVQRGFDALGRRDLDGLLTGWAPDAVWDLNAWGVGTFEGLTAIGGFVEDWLGNYEDYLAEPEQILDLGHGVVFVAYREVARPLGSQGRLERRQAHVTLLREDSIQQMTMYADIDEARAAAERLAEERQETVPKGPTTPDLEEVTRQIVEAVKRRDYDAMLAVYSSDAMYWRGPPGLDQGERFEGIAAIRRFFDDWFATFEDIELQADELRDLGNGVTFGSFLMRGRPLASTASIEFRYATVALWADGLIRETWNYTDIDQARADAERLAADRG